MEKFKCDYDTAWKKIIREYFPLFLEFFFKDIYEGIDFQKGFKFLDKELEKIYKKSGTGKKYPDLLIEVHLKNGETKLIIIHIEVQAYFKNKETKENFPERIYTYNYRGKDILKKDVVSLVVLLDKDREYREDTYRRRYWGFEIRFKYPIVKIIDYEGKEMELEGEENPFGEVVIAQLKSMKVVNKSEAEKKEIKMDLIKRLYKKGLKREDIINLFEFIDFIINLSKEGEKELTEEINKYEEEVIKMPVVAPYRELAREEGFAEGIERGIQKGIERGIQKGVEKGIQRGIERGTEQKSRDILIRIIEKRIRKLSKEEKEVILNCRDLKKLDGAIDEALSSNSVEEILNILR